MFDDFNPDSTVRVLPIISVINSLGVETPVNNEIVTFDTGGGISLEIDDEDNEISLTTEGADDSLYYAQKLETLKTIQEGEVVNGPYVDPDSGETPAGDAWTFTDQSIYIATLDEKTPEPETGVVFLVNDPCMVVSYYGINTPISTGSSSAPSGSSGVGSSSGSSTGSSSAPVGSSSGNNMGKHELALTNICGPCIDCPTYTTLETYILRIDESVEYVWKLAGDKNTNTIPVSPDGFPLQSFSGVYVQTLALLSFWNHLVHKQSVKAAGQAYGQAASGTVYYKNISTTTQLNVTMTLTFIFAVKDLNTMVISAWNGINADNTEIRILDRQNAINADLQSATLNTNGATIVFEKASVAPGEAIYGDAVLMMTNAGLFDSVDEQVIVLVRTEYTNTHLDASYTDTEDKIIYFKPPNAPEGSGSGSGGSGAPALPSGSGSSSGP
jgi:uncharacterized membrane protein YgcG